MEKKLRWYDLLTINSYWLGINIATGIITPVLLPALVVLFMPPEQKNTNLALVRMIGLAVAMLVQPLAGLFSDRSTHRLGRRRPFIFAGAVLNVVFLIVIGASTLFYDPAASSSTVTSSGFTTAFLVLILGNFLWQISTNIGHGALQGLIPDLVPDDQRGKASGIKAVFELLPSILIALLGIGALVDNHKFWQVIIIIMAGYVITMLITMIWVKEKPLEQKPADKMQEQVLRIIFLTIIFVVFVIGAQYLVRASTTILPEGSSRVGNILIVGLTGLLAMAGAVLLGVYVGARVGIGKEANSQKRFIWWVVNRLLFLAAIGSVQGFVQYFLADVLLVPEPATTTTYLMMIIAIFLLISALAGGYLSDKVGRAKLVGAAGLIAAAGTVLLLFSKSIPMVIVSGSIIGLGTGLFFTTNWALGTDLVPADKAGKYLGISNLAGAGAGIVGAGIGGPMADFFNGMQQGLGYQVIFAIYAALFVLSTVILATRIAGKQGL